MYYDVSFKYSVFHCYWFCESQINFKEQKSKYDGMEYTVYTCTKKSFALFQEA